MAFHSLEFLELIIDRIHAGVFVVDKAGKIVLWNRFMSTYSGKSSESVVNQNLYQTFPELPQKWLQQKIDNVLILKNFSFTSWENRPYLFRFEHNRPITGGVDHMRQNCTFMPIYDKETGNEYVCVTIYDVTDSSVYETLLQDAVKRLADTSSKDALTQIFNRGFLVQTFEREFARAKRYGNNLSFILFDLDHFKAINDKYGHIMGDEVLKHVSKVIFDSLRESDTLGRYGGEEFGIVLPETDLTGAVVLAERLRVKIASSPIFHEGQKLSVTTSIGVAAIQEEFENIEHFIHASDLALYHSKENRRNKVTAYDPAVHQDVGKQLESKISEPAIEWWINRIVIGYR
jgi:diguanylate cyclase (GGDEF)-like protein/PAS domain S-box-containing protein